MIKNIFTKTRIKILIVVLVSFVVVKTVSPQIFLADSSKINPEFITKLQNAPGKMIAGIIGLFNKNNDFANVKIVTPPDDAVFKSISKGVSAAEDPTTGQTLIQVQAGTKYRIVGTVIINGKEYPKIEFVE